MFEKKKATKIQDYHQTPSAMERCWMYARHCCCRHGLYPLAVAPILTAACVISIYSSSGCQFVEVDIGFEPEPNAAWNSSTATLGFWYRYHPNGDGGGDDHKYDPALLDSLHQNCEWYSEAFDETYIQTDRTWKVSRIMATVAACGSFASTLLSWTFVGIGPCVCPVSFLWPGVLLPLVMISFIAEGSKFMFFDMGICRNSLFRENGSAENDPPEASESCELGESAIFGMLSGALLLVALLMVCLNVPKERKLDPNYGLPDGDTDKESEDYPQGGSSRKRSTRTFDQRPSKEATDAMEQKEEQPKEHDEETPPAEPSEYSDDFYDDDISSFGFHSVSKSGSVSKPDSSYSSAKREAPRNKPDSSQQLGPSDTSASVNQHLRHHSVDEILGDIQEEERSTTMDEPPVEDEIRVSESRLSTLASVEQKAAGSDGSVASSMLEDLVRDLDSSYSQSSNPHQHERTTAGIETHALALSARQGYYP